MSKEPVAWLIQTKTAHQFTFKEPTIIPLDATVIPLYTHPVKQPMMVLDGNRVYSVFKELTDEEIKDVATEAKVYLSYEIMNFARAILRKAQAK